MEFEEPRAVNRELPILNGSFRLQVSEAVWGFKGLMKLLQGVTLGCTRALGLRLAGK